jgi:hypothetical protein
MMGDSANAGNWIAAAHLGIIEAETADASINLQRMAARRPESAVRWRPANRQHAPSHRAGCSGARRLSMALVASHDAAAMKRT